LPLRGRMLPADGDPGSSGDRGQAGVGGKVAGGGERAGVADLEQDAGCRPDPDAGHGGQDGGKRVGIKNLFHLHGDSGALIQSVAQRRGELGQHGLGGGRPGHGDALLV